jgi:hypothetical protein
MEEEYIEEAIRTVGKPSTPYYPALINALFKQGFDMHKEFTFDYYPPSILPTTTSSLGLSYSLQGIKEACVSVFQLHGAVEFEPSNILPHVRRRRRRV